MKFIWIKILIRILNLNNFKVNYFKLVNNQIIN